LSASLAELFSLGKLYPWPRPESCPRCSNRRLWGHGYVRRYFDGVPKPLWIKRWRCPDCGGVHTCRPDSHWRRFLAPISVILVSLVSKIMGLRWPQDESRQRQQYWYRGFIIQSRFDGLPPVSVESLHLAGIVVATHSTADRATIPWPGTPYRRLAATEPP
jgi:hypothetical protein